ncbi:hypothetical protein Tco_0911242 [Tanacetum coccineum]|uniref:Uncharacterized protein n=1 Tax=Tanacetum coccineum TaxID=301880 RepID=A0ABQ5CWV0_9ASTR
MDDLTSEGHDLLSSRVILSEDDFRRGCERPSDLESGFYKDMDKLGPSYTWEIERIDLDGPLEGKSNNEVTNPKDKSGLDASAKLTRAELNKHSEDADLSKDKSGPESSPEFRRS